MKRLNLNGLMFMLSLISIGIIVNSSSCGKKIEDEAIGKHTLTVNQLNLLNIKVDKSLIDLIEDSKRDKDYQKNKSIELYFAPEFNAIYLKGEGLNNINFNKDGIQLDFREIFVSDETLAYLKIHYTEQKDFATFRSYADVDCPGCISYIECIFNGSFYILRAVCESDSAGGMSQCDFFYCYEGSELTSYCRGSSSVTLPGGVGGNYFPCPNNVCGL